MKVEYVPSTRISFYCETDEELQALFAAERELFKKGMSVDTGLLLSLNRRDWWLN